MPGCLSNPRRAASPSIQTASDAITLLGEDYPIFKDNDDRRHYDFGELVSGLGGSDVGLVQPPFSILINPQANGGLGSTGVRTQEFVIENIPFKYAIPMLTAWDLGYITNDQHVKEIGTWIDEMHYNDPNDPPRTLRYKVASVLVDDDNWPDFFSRPKATILGLQSTSVVIPNRKAPDLVPFSPSGTAPNAFCRLEPELCTE